MDRKMIARTPDIIQALLCHSGGVQMYVARKVTIALDTNADPISE
jgi:hypothetical protein